MRMFFPPSHAAYSKAMSLIDCVFYYRWGPILFLKKNKKTPTKPIQKIPPPKINILWSQVPTKETHRLLASDYFKSSEMRSVLNVNSGEGVTVPGCFSQPSALQVRVKASSSNRCWGLSLSQFFFFGFLTVKAVVL